MYYYYVLITIKHNIRITDQYFNQNELKIKNQLF